MLPSIRNALFAAACAVCLFGCSTAAQTTDAQRSSAAMGKIVYTLNDVPEGATFGVEDLEEREVPVGKIPMDAISSSAIVAGRTAKYGVPAGQVVSQHDLAMKADPTLVKVHLKANQAEKLRSIAEKRKTTPESLTLLWITEKLNQTTE